MTGKETVKKILAAVFWVIIWQLAAMAMKNSIIFVGPADMLRSLGEQIQKKEFWLSVGNSSFKIMGGFHFAF